MMKAFAGGAAVSAGQVSKTEFDEMKALVADLKAQLATSAPSSPIRERRV